MLAGSPELHVDSLRAALPDSVYSPSQLGCFGTVGGLQAVNYNFLHSLCGALSHHFKSCHITCTLCCCQLLTFPIWSNRNTHQQTESHLSVRLEANTQRNDSSHNEERAFQFIQLVKHTQSTNVN